MPQQSQPLALPQVAQARLSHDQQGGAVISFQHFSDYLTHRQLGLDPIGPVTGLSVIHRGGIQLGGYRQAVELDVYTQAITLGLYSAAGRMQEEAAMLGADGVILRFIEERSLGEEHEYAWGGTAVRFTPRPGMLRTSLGLPFICNVGTQSLYQMLRLGMAPVNYGFGVCVYHVPHRSLRQALGQTFQNTEVPQFTDAWYTARELALFRLQGQMEQHGATVVLQTEAIIDADVFGEHTAEFRFWGHGFRPVDGLASLIPNVDLAPEALIARGLQVTGPEHRAG